MAYKNLSAHVDYGLQSFAIRVVCSLRVRQNKIMTKRYRRAYRTVQDWQEATGTNTNELARQIGVSKQHLNNVLKKSRRCSLYIALKLAKITNVPVETICEWPPEYENTAQ